MKELLQWTPEPPAGDAPGTPVRIWCVRLDTCDQEHSRWAESLSPEETDRARAMRFEVHRRRFVAAHGALREIVATRLGRRPDELVLTSDAAGKPRLRLETGEEDLRFNLSHSHDLALVALTVGREVGVDVERIDERTDISRLARRYFAHEEWAALEALPARERLAEFFHFWTLKEAYIKAVGLGLGVPLDSFAITPSTVRPPHLLRDDRGGTNRWAFETLAAGEGYAAGVATDVG